MQVARAPRVLREDADEVAEEIRAVLALLRDRGGCVGGRIVIVLLDSLGVENASRGLARRRCTGIQSLLGSHITWGDEIDVQISQETLGNHEHP